jgi:RNA polymerase sigma-70 factor (sigma-E family)
VTFEQFVTARWSALYRTAYLLTGQRLDAEEAVQATLVKAYASWSRIRRVEVPDAYVHRMLVNEFLSGTRRQKRARDYAARQQPVAPMPTHEAAVLDRVGVWEHVMALPPRQRAVIVLRFYEDLSERRIAEVLGCAPGTVKSQTSAALRSLQTRIGAGLDEEGTLR